MVQRIIIIVIGFGAIGAAVFALARGYLAPEIVEQPIAFNHKIHAEAAKLDCTTICHTAAPSEVYAGLPSKWVCYECHDPDEEYPDRPVIARLAEYVDLDEDIAWRRVAVTSPDVYFSHRRHVTAGQIECGRCHPGVESAAEPLSRVSQVLGMNQCLDCHEHEGADVDCLACHR